MRPALLTLVMLGASCVTTPQPATPQPPRPATAPAEPTADPEISAEAYRSVLEAELEMQEGDVLGAIQLLREAVLHDPQSPYLHVRLAEAWLEAGDAGQARASAQEALALAPTHLAALRIIGRAWAAAGEASEAKRAFEAALKSAPADREASHLLAELLVERGELDAAERVIGNLMEREPGAVDGYIALARLFAERGEVERAFAHVDRALARESDDADALGLKLTLLWALGRFADALPTARALASAAGDDGDMRRDLLTAHALAGVVDEADALAKTWLLDDDSEAMRLVVSEAWERAGELERAARVLDPPGSAPLSPRSAAEVARLRLALRPPAPALPPVDVVCPLAEAPVEQAVAAYASSTCARALLAAGKPKEAAALLEKRIAALGRLPRLIDALVAAAKRGGTDRAKALEAADAALLAAPADAEIVAMAARAHEELSDVAGARRILDEALRARPTDADLLFALARHLDRQGQPLPAVEIVERLMDRGRKGLDELNFAAFALAEAGVRTDDARRFAWRAVVQDPLNGYVVDTLGWAQLVAGDVDGAVDTLRRADRLAPGEGEIVFHLASALERHGEAKQALADAKRALELLEGDDPVRPRVEAMVQKLTKAGS